MAKINLNDKSVRREAPETGQIELWDKTLPGFGLRIAAGGSRTYFVMRRLNGKLARRTVGVAPPLSVLHGAELREGEYWPGDARKRAREMLEAMARGIDPKPPKVTAAAPLDDLSFKSVADKYLDDKLQGGGADLKSKGELERKLKTDLKEWHARPIAEIKGREIRELIRTKAQASPISANRLLSFIKRVFRWAASQDYIDADPAAAVDKPGKENSRDRYLTEDEIRLFWRAADEIGDPAGRLFKLALVTAQRRGEVAGLRWSELGTLEYRAQDKTLGKDVLTTGRAWLLPAERTKRGVAHTVPLSPLAAKLIDGAPKLKFGKAAADHVFPSGARGDQPITGWSRYKARLDEQIGQLMAEDAKEEYDPKRHALAPWHIHDLRATAATFMEMDRLGIPRPVISRILNHSEGDGRSMTARYTRHKWDKEAADALDAWAAELGRIVGLNVLQLKGGVA
jgi:integrase